MGTSTHRFQWRCASAVHRAAPSHQFRSCVLRPSYQITANPGLMRLPRPPHLRNLRAFCVAAHHRSFKIAADELFLTPSAVSHQMKELEDSLGVRLFERKTRAVD